MDTHQENIRDVKAHTASVLATLPRIGEGVNIIEKDIIDLQTKKNGKLGNLRNYRRFMSALTLIQ